MEKAIVTIAGKEYELKFSIGFWRRIKESCGIDQSNIESKLSEDFGNIAQKIIIESVIGSEKPSLNDIEECLDRSVMDVFETAIINGMTKAEREMVDLAKKKRASVISSMEEKMGEEKK